jgi:Mg2+ and Co2+ transporter CorA
MDEEWREALRSIIQDEVTPSLERIESEQLLIKRAVLETNDSLKRLEGIQESQHHIIELLSARSIEQEAQLKRIK